MSTATTMTTTTRNLSILPASSSISVSNLPMAQVRPASAVPSSPQKVTLAQVYAYFILFYSHIAIIQILFLFF